MIATSTAATAHDSAFSRMRGASFSRVSRSSNFESRNPRMRYAGSRMTAAATTGPNSDPRPTSSTPATNLAPASHACFSYFSVHFSFFRKRSFKVAAETDGTSQSSNSSCELGWERFITGLRSWVDDRNCKAPDVGKVGTKRKGTEICAFGVSVLKRTLLDRNQLPLRRVMRIDIVFEDLDELGHDVVALQGRHKPSVDVHRSLRLFERSRQRDSDVRVLRFTRPVDYAAHDRDFHLFHARVARLPVRHLLAQVTLDLLRHLL